MTVKDGEIEYVASKKVLVIGIYAFAFVLSILAVSGRRGLSVILALFYTFSKSSS